MEHCRAAERALVTALVLGGADPADLSGRLRVSDFTDPAAGLIFETIMDGPAGRRSVQELPRLLARRGALRSDGYPVRELLEWMPTTPTPAHPQAWAALVVAGSTGRLVEQAGIRLVQACDTADRAGGVGRVLAVAAAQRAAVHAAARRWRELPARWRHTLPAAWGLEAPAAVASEVPAAAARDGVADVERELLSGLIAGPHLLPRVPWLDPVDFADPACGEVFTTIRRLRDGGRPVDLVTVTALLEPADRSAPAGTSSGAGKGRADLHPQSVVHAWVPVLARQVLSAAVLRRAYDAGEQMAALATAPARAGGLAEPVLAGALQALDGLQLHAVRWQQAHRPVSEREGAVGAARPGRSLSRTSTLPGVPPVADRSRSALDRTGS